MKAVILSAGQGSRLLPLTMEMPKCLVAVQGRAILMHQLAALAEAGVDEAVVVVGYRHKQVEAFLQQDLPVRATTLLNPFWAVANSIGSVWAARDHLRAPFCLMNGDTLFDGAVLANALARAPDGVGLLVERLHGAAEHDDMRVTVADGRVAAVSKFLEDGATTHRSLGVVTSKGAEGAYLDALDRVIRGEEGISSYHHAIVAELAGTTAVTALERSPGNWQEIDRPEDIATWDRTHGGGAR